MSYAIFVDSTVCSGCRACQVACKQWHDLPAEETLNRGTYENPPDLSGTTYKVVRMKEVVADGKLRWLYFPEQCRHCIDAPCLEVAAEPAAIYRDDATGAIVYTSGTKELVADEIIEACPYNIPRKGPNGVLSKCDMCNDRTRNGLQPACVKTCPTGAMNFGPREEMIAKAEKRLAEIQEIHPKAILTHPEEVSVFYLLAHDPFDYHSHAIASLQPRGISRYAALKRMLGPFARAATHIG
jgi:formate dehydrogenase iron-sulfur subunit